MLDVSGAINANGLKLINSGSTLPGMTNDVRWPLEVQGGDGGASPGVVLTNTSSDPRSPTYIDFRDKDCIGNDKYRGHLLWTNDGNFYIGTSTPGASGATDYINLDPNGLVGIPAVPVASSGTTARLAVAGLVESTNGGFKFPDGTVQNSAASGASGFPQQQGRNGWQKLPNGFIIQWGINEASFSNANPDNPASFLWLPFTVTFPIAFPNYCASVQVQGTPGGPGVDWATAFPESFTTTQFTYVFYDTVQNWTSRTAWMAIGY